MSHIPPEPPDSASGSGYPEQGYPNPSAGSGYPRQQPPPSPYEPQVPPGQQPGYGYPPQAYGEPPYGQDPAYGATGYGAQPGYGPVEPPPGYPPQPGYGRTGYGPAGQQPVSPSDENTWGILSHLSIPFFVFVGPLVAYLLFKDRSEYLKAVSTEALNFSILYSIVMLVASILTVVVIGAIIIPVAIIGSLILCILATVAASKHEFYKYPVNVRFIK